MGGKLGQPVGAHWSQALNVTPGTLGFVSLAFFNRATLNINKIHHLNHFQCAAQ